MLQFENTCFLTQIFSQLTKVSMISRPSEVYK
jgi:hypothetical protein